MTFQSFADVDAWVAAKAPNGAEKLRGRVESGQIAGTRLPWARAWLARHDRQLAGEAQSREQELLERATIAAEFSAAQAKVSADQAVGAVKWARWAVVVAVAALVVGAWPLIKDVGRPSAPVARPSTP